MEFEFEDYIVIPHERIAVLIGKKGEVKRRIEHSLGVKLKIDSVEGHVSIKGEDNLNITTAMSIVRAVARGFNPDIALMLLDDNIVFETINLTDYSGKSKKKLIRLRGRAIGVEGKARVIIEELSDTHINIYGKTLGIIGDYEHVELARKAFESLLLGSRHSTIYAWLEKQKKELRTAQMIHRL